MFDYIFITHLPSFYKINLYNEIAKHKKIHVIFVAQQSTIRTSDFVKDTYLFSHTVLTTGTFETRNKWKTSVELLRTLYTHPFQKVVVGGWDLIEFWLTVCVTRKKKNALALESTLQESSVVGVKRVVKKLFLARISQVFASGLGQQSLLTACGYRGSVSVTHGVGIANTPPFTRVERTYKKRFLFVGRISPEKNISLLLDVFQSLPEYTLTVVGDGAQKHELRQRASSNVLFLDHIANTALSDLFLKHDILILPSLREPWGLVVEEALYFGMPVVVSSYCGASDLVVHGSNGYVFDPLSQQLAEILQSITAETYRGMVEYVRQASSIGQKNIQQVQVYL
jgi:glycosyltransferase involved in cell wall biosynthesis